jgi:hypothetical protein
MYYVIGIWIHMIHADRNFCVAFLQYAQPDFNAHMLMIVYL